MSTPRVKAVLDAVVAQLATITVAGGYNYTPDDVVPVSQVTEAVLDPKKSLRYFVSYDRVERRPYTNKETDADVFLDVLGFYHLPTDYKEGFDKDKVFIATPARRWDIQAQMQQDVEKALNGGDGLLGGVAHRTGLQITLWDMGPENTYLEPWAIVLARVQVPIRYRRDQP